MILLHGEHKCILSVVDSLNVDLCHDLELSKGLSFFSFILYALAPDDDFAFEHHIKSFRLWSFDSVFSAFFDTE